MAYHLNHLLGSPVNSTAIPGRYLAHNNLDMVHRAFLAVDLSSDARQLTDPTLTQSARLARVNYTYVWWAKKRQAERAAIEAGLIPLVPPRIAGVLPKKSNGNGNGSPRLCAYNIGDDELAEIVRVVGTNHVLEIAAMVEAAHN